ncbi:MAG: hypothetical protein ACR2OW_08230, partial [Methyloligellaceae bacterium]
MCRIKTQIVRFFCLAFLTFLTVTLSWATQAQTGLKDVLTNYANIAEAKYQDSLATANELQTAVETFLKTPNQKNIQAA